MNMTLNRFLDFVMMTNHLHVDVLVTDVYGNIVGDRFLLDRGDWLKFGLRTIDELTSDELASLLDMTVCQVDALGRDHFRVEVLAENE